MGEYAVNLRTDQWIQATHLGYVVMLAQSLQLRVELVNAVFVCHMGLLCDLFEQLSQKRQAEISLYGISRTHPLPLYLLEALLRLSLSIRTTAARCGRIPAATPCRRLGPNSFRLLARVLSFRLHVLLLILRFGRLLLPKQIVDIHVNRLYKMNWSRTSS